MTTQHWRRPSWFALLLTLASIAVFVRLGVWQLDRGAEAQRLLAAFADAPKAAIEDFAAMSGVPSENRFPHVRVRGRFLADRGWLRDEQVRNGTLGVEVYAPFVPTDGGAILLVDRGWIAWSHQRDTHPELPLLPTEETTLVGVYAPYPGNGLRVGGNALTRQTSWPKLTLAIDAKEIAADLGRPLRPRVLLLDADSATNFVREWTPSMMSAERHRGYAVQWFAFAVVAAAIFLLLHRKKAQE
ncbi:MAG: SURF1 family protein [Proteobacteria bacterium]|nr:SURF1 family protein [Pseudomonadota bacterium]